MKRNYIWISWLMVVAMILISGCSWTPKQEATPGQIESTAAAKPSKPGNKPGKPNSKPGTKKEDTSTNAGDYLTSDIPNLWMTAHLDKLSQVTIPDCQGETYTMVNENQPYFTAEEKQCTREFRQFSELDRLGRCGVAYANLSINMRPEGERGSIGSIRPTGWHTVKYNGWIDGNYLYNRCHLLGYQLSGENSNEKNLITGTRYLNVEGMMPWENKVNDYLTFHPANHVLYRVTPLFDEDNLLAGGVLMEAWSVEDSGQGICFNVYCYNVQPGIGIDYATGDNWALEEMLWGESSAEDGNSGSSTGDSDSGSGFANPEKEKVETQPQIVESADEISDFIVNKSSRKFHLTTCSSVDDMSGFNRAEFHGTIHELKDLEYEPCHRCLKQFAD